MNSENSRTSKYHVLVLKLTDKLDPKKVQKSVALSNLILKNIKSSYNKNKFIISAPTWSNKFELPNGSYLISDIQDYFKHILQKHNENNIPSIKVYIKLKIELHLKLKLDIILNV